MSHVTRTPLSRSESQWSPGRFGWLFKSSLNLSRSQQFICHPESEPLPVECRPPQSDKITTCTWRGIVWRPHYRPLVAAKSELCKCLQAVASATPTAPGIDGLSKFVNSKGVPISRRGNDPAHRRVLEAEDVVGMLTIADLWNAALPTFVAADLDRVPGLYWSSGDAVSANVEKLTTVVDDIVKRMKEMENKLTTPSTYVDNVNTGHPARLSDVHPASCDKGAAGESSGIYVLRQPVTQSTNLESHLRVWRRT